MTVTEPQYDPWWETTQFDFIRIPKALSRNPYYADLSPESRMLYGFLLDRASLSWANGETWRTAAGEPFVIYTLTEIQQRLNCGSDKATAILRKLEKHRLIRKDRPKRDGPYHIVVYPFSEDGNSGLPSRENPHSRVRKNKPAESGKPGRNHTDNNKTEYNNTDIVTLMREDIHKQIEYDYLLQDFSREQLDPVVDVMVQVLTSPAKAINIGGIPTDSALVKQQLRSIPPSQIQYLFDHMEQLPDPVKNHRAYYLARLFDPPGVVDAFIKEQHSYWEYGIM